MAKRRQIWKREVASGRRKKNRKRNGKARAWSSKSDGRLVWPLRFDIQRRLRGRSVSRKREKRSGKRAGGNRVGGERRRGGGGMGVFRAG